MKQFENNEYSVISKKTKSGESLKMTNEDYFLISKYLNSLKNENHLNNQIYFEILIDNIYFLILYKQKINDFSEKMKASMYSDLNLFC